MTNGRVVMAENCEAPDPIGGFTATPKALHDFFFVKIVNALYGLYSSKV